MQKEKGFTLIELMVTIAVLAIIASIAAPSFNNFVNNYNHKRSYERVMGELKIARSKAAAERALVVVCVGVSSEDACLTTTGVVTARQASFKNSKRVLNIPPQSELTVTGDTHIIFSPNGSSQTSLVNSSALSKKMTICYKKKSREILVSKLGAVSLGAEGACS